MSRRSFPYLVKTIFDLGHHHHDGNDDDVDDNDDDDDDDGDNKDDNDDDNDIGAFRLSRERIRSNSGRMCGEGEFYTLP